jgi:ribosomal protein S18 acetylase RimI-like enzyme
MKNIRPATANDMKNIACVHKQVFKDHFLGKMPISFLRKYYHSFLFDSNIFLVYTNENQEIIGFVMGGEAPVLAQCKKRFLKRNWLHLLYAVMITPPLYPMVLKRLKKHQKFTSSVSFSLLSIGVREDAKRQGIGKQLIEQFETKLKEINTHTYRLSVYKTNFQAIQFYQKCTFIQEKETDNGIYFYKYI